MRRKAFTLVELIIAVAIVFVLMLAIGWIFGKTSETIGTGLALSDVSREHRNSRAVMRDDFRNALPAEQQPFVLISSEIVPAFLNAADRLADRDYSPGLTGAARLEAIRTRDFNEDGAEDPADPIEHRPPFVYDARNHRADRLTFFVNKSEGYSRRTGANAMVERDANGVPNGTDAMVSYGLLNVVANAASSDRSLWPPAIAPGAGDVATNPQNFYAGDWILGRQVLVLIPEADDAPITSHYATLQHNAPSVPVMTRGAIQSARLDVVAMDVEQARAMGAMANWWTAPTRDDVGAMTVVRGGLNYPFETIRWVGATDPDRAARQVPQFMPGCAQFIVEFAGDYLTQTPGTGAITAGEPDGQIDYWQLPGGGPTQTRWYGCYRDANNNGTVTTAATQLGDVGPVPGASGTFQRATVAGDGTGAYVAAWQPEQLEAGLGPKLIRLTVQLVDSNGRLAEGQTIENIFPMP